jgi:hypothetical protein
MSNHRVAMVAGARSPSGIRGQRPADEYLPRWPMRWRVARLGMDSSACVRRGPWQGLFFSLANNGTLGASISDSLPNRRGLAAGPLDALPPDEKLPEFSALLMIGQDSAHLADRLAVILAEVAGGDDLFRGDASDVRALIANQDLLIGLGRRANVQEQPQATRSMTDQGRPSFVHSFSQARHHRRRDAMPVATARKCVDS